MSVNKQKDEGNPNTLEIPTNTEEEELIHVIQMTLYNIVTRVNYLSKCAEDMIDEICEEADKLSFKVTVLEEQVIQKTSGITYEDQSGGLSLKITESKTFQSTTIQTQQVYSSKQVPVKMCETHDTHALTLPMNRAPFCPDDTGGLEVSPDASYCFELYKEKTVPRSDEEKGAKPKQKKQHKDHPNKLASVPRTQLMEDEVSVYHAPVACSEASCSYVDQPDERSSFSSFPLCEINKLVTRAVGKVISNCHYLPMPGAREVKNSLTYVRYGTGRGEELKPQPRNHLKTKVFVSPTAPASAPALPADWLAALKASKEETPSSSRHHPTQLPSPVLRIPAATSPAACVPSVPDRAVPITPPKGDFCTPASEPFPYYELTTDDLLAQAEDQGMPPPLSSLAVTSPSVQTRATVTHLTGRTSVVQSPIPSGMKLSKSSIPSSPRSSLSSSLNYRIPPPRYPVILSPRSSIPQNSSPLSSISSRPQTSRAWIPSPRNSLSPSITGSDTTRSRCSEAQSLRPPAAQSQRSSSAQSQRPSAAQSQRPSAAQSQRSSAAQSQRSSSAQSQRPSAAQSQRSSSAQSQRPSAAQSQRPSAAQSQRSSRAQSTRHLISPQQNSSSLKSGLSVTPSARAPVNPTFKQSPPATPVIAKVKNALMAAIKGVLLYNTEDQ